jgi:benzoyl-CoA reductase/2-hydroxyglutaryl-CoA dehydratase subunit BcrC/BadD/HgdB
LKKVGFTTSIPVETVFTAGLIPVDLNNIFITNSSPGKYIEMAESVGFPRSTCAWIKGIYSAILDTRDVDTIIGVVEGDHFHILILEAINSLKMK